jgi:hypothetical protein
MSILKEAEVGCRWRSGAGGTDHGCRVYTLAPQVRRAKRCWNCAGAPARGGEPAAAAAN